jgi:hypothetical protein
MPFRVHRKNGIILSEMEGTIALPDVVELSKAVALLETPPVPDRITDLTGVTQIDLTFQDIWNLAQNRQALRFANSFKSALVASEPVQIGFCRMFLTVGDHPQVEFEMFATREEALAWIGLPCGEPSAAGPDRPQ